MPGRSDDTDLLFKALADPSRRRLLDLLHAQDGRTLNDLCELENALRYEIANQRSQWGVAR